MLVRDVMVRDVITLNAKDPLVAAEEIMGLRRFRHLPVTDKGRLKIADFGIAALVGAAADRSGTPPYMAPEQLAGDDHRRDRGRTRDDRRMGRRPRGRAGLPGPGRRGKMHWRPSTAMASRVKALRTMPAPLPGWKTTISSTTSSWNGKGKSWTTSTGSPTFPA